MQWKTPKNTSKYQWTQHVSEKMHYYGLSEQKVLGVIRNPKRIETGIVENTVAVMMPVGNISKGIKSKWGRPVSVFASAEASPRQLSSKEESWNQEIWVMYQLREGAGVAKQQTSISKNISGSKAKKIQKLRSAFNADKKIIIISAWRYPGVSPKNNPIPEEILREIEEIALK